MASTLSDVAERVGVSTATVSRVLRGLQEPRDPELHQRILSAARDLEYRPSPHAQALRRGRSATIRLLSSSGTAFVTNFKLCSLVSNLAQLGRPITDTRAGTMDTVENWLDETLAAVPEAAVIFMSSDRLPVEVIADLCTQLNDADICPMVVDYHCPTLPPEIPCDAIWVDRIEGSRMAVEHLIDQGHEKIALIATDRADRREGYHKALESHDIGESFFGAWRGEAVGTRYADQAREITARLLAEEPEITAMFCQSDLVAVGAMRAVLESGRRVPDDVAIVGFDGDPWTAMLPIALTTMVQPSEELCARASQILAARLGGDDHSWQRIALSPKLVVRESCGARGDRSFTV